MGQVTTGILYGVECPELPDEGDEAAYDLVRRWEKAKRINRPAKGLRVRFEHEGGKDLLGVWVAAGGSGKDGAPYFLEAAVRLVAVAEVFGQHVRQAAALWDRFAAWAVKAEALALPVPELWLTPCEVA